MKKNKKLKVFVAMSGGVDSSVAALLLKHKNYDLVGCFIKGWYPPGVVCNWKEDRRDAMRVCAKLGIPFMTIDATKEYKRDVVDYMLKEYRMGRTPNPDVMCNKNIKFGVFLKKALAMGADYIATGHYVKLVSRKLKVESRKKQLSTLYILHSAYDKNKDQSYFLWTLTQKQLKYCIFPIGNLLKSKVKEIARKNNLHTAEKRESMGVCFIGEFDMVDFLKRYINPKKGEVITVDGMKIGEHEGVMFYTIGQRHGFSRGGGIPYYIVAKDIKKNLLIVADKAREEKFYRKEVEIEEVNWILGKAPAKNKIYKARIRYRQPLQSCRLRVTRYGLLVTFSKPQRAVTPGQSLVLYDGQEILGGGIIV